MSETTTQNLSLKALQDAVAGRAAAFRCRTFLQPAGGKGTTIFPPTYERGEYATVGAREEEQTGRKLADQVLLDSVQSQANRMELALLDAWEAERITLPVITVDFAGHDLEKDLRVTSLEAPHRIADAILRDSMYDGKPFRKSDVGKVIDDADARNATALFRLCPTALVFGMWDSTGPKGGLGAKFQRTIVSEIVGLDAQVGKKTASRIDPTQIQRNAAVLYKSADPDGIPWTLDAEKAARDKKSPLKLGKDGRPSEANHGNVTPTIADGGVRMSEAIQTTVLSLTALRRLRFPLEPGKKSDPEVDVAACTALAALALCAAVLTREQGCDLRSRCQLFPTQKIEWELLDKPGEQPTTFNMTGDEAIELFNAAVNAAKEAGLPWQSEEIVLKPSPELAELVKRSQRLAASAVVEGE